jgi:hypothetical protein
MVRRMITRSPAAAAGGGGGSLLSSVQADGWQGVWKTGTPPTFDPNGAPVFETFSRQGFDANATAITFNEQIPILRRVRQVWPNHLTDTADRVALGDYVLSTDTIVGGGASGSSEISPKPIAAWVMRDRQMVGDTIEWEIVAFHYYARQGRQVACVRVRGNDGTTQTPWQVVSTPVVSTYCEDANAVEVYRGVLDISTLAPGTVALPTAGWLEAEVMPWVGADNATYALSSVLKSEQETEIRGFTRRFFSRNVSRAANPPLAYVSPAGASPPGNDATGVWSLTDTTAAPNPFLTVTGALTAMTTSGAGVTNSIADGCEIRITGAVDAGAAVATARPQRVAALKITRAPGTSRAAAVVTYASVAFRMRLGQSGLQLGLAEGAVWFDDMTLTRGAALTILGETAQTTQISMRNVVWNNTNAATNPLASAHLYAFGLTIAGTSINISTTGATSQKRILRGLVVDTNFTAIEAFVNVGCNITRPNNLPVSDTTRPRICYSNKFFNPSASTGVTAWTGTTTGDTIGPIVWFQNLIEATHTTAATAGFRFANDTPAVGNIVHAVIGHNTNTGYNSVNRCNFAYDESPDPRFHKFIKYVGDLPSQLNTKGDIFAGAILALPNRIGQFAYTHGVGCTGTYSLFQTNSASQWSEFQTFPGIGSSIGTDPNNPQAAYSSIFIDYQGVTGSGGTPTPGAIGGGNYNLQPSSPARNRVTNKVRSFDIAGVAVATVDSAGAYA